MRNELDMAKAGGRGTVLADVTVLIAVVPGVGPCLGEKWSSNVSSCRFLCQISPKMWSFQTGKAFPACCEAASPVPGGSVEFLKGERGQNVCSCISKLLLKEWWE